MLVLSAMVVLYYNMLIAYALYYFFASLTSKLPWSDCGHAWNGPHCKTGGGGINGAIVNVTNSTRPAEEYWE